MLEAAYRDAVAAVGRPARELVPVLPRGAAPEAELPFALALVGGWVMDFGDWPAYVFWLPRGRCVLGHSHPRSLYPKSADRPKLFEAHQCELAVAEEVSITRDWSTNGTLVIPPEVARAQNPLRITDALRAAHDAPCPKNVRPHDVFLTQYAELVLLRLR
jgi:hypothetical protein